MFNNSTIQQFNNHSGFSQNHIYTSEHKGGYALMLSIVVSSIVLSIGLSLFNIVQKELILSATGRDSQFAFYSADGGVECALYWDIKKLEFPSNAVDFRYGAPPFPGASSGIDCGLTDFTDTDKSRYEVELDDNGPDDTDPLYNPGDPDAEPPILPSGYYGDLVTINFQINFESGSSDSPGSCAVVNIKKQGNGQIEPGYSVITTIDSRGYNDECPAGGGAFDNPALVERAISVTY